MPVLGTLIRPRVQWMRWDGTNGQQIADMLDQMADDAWWSFAGESTVSGYVTFRRELNGVINIVTGSVANPNIVMVMGAQFPTAVRDDHFAFRYMELAEEAARIAPSIPVPSYTLISAVGQGNLPALLLNGTTTVAWTWDVTMPATITPAHVHWRAHAGTSVLSSIQLQAIANPITVTATGGTIALRAVGLASLAGIVQLDASMLTSP